MRRPEGFDGPPPRSPQSSPPGRPGQPRRPSQREEPKQESRPGRPAAKQPRAARAERTPARPSRRQEHKAVGRPARQDESTARLRRERKEARREERAAAKQRRRFEREEVKRFTRRTRRRRIAWLSAAGVVAVVAGVVAVAVFSPLLALRTIEVEGTSATTADSIREAVSDQLGTPIALVDQDRIREELSRFPIIRSFVTEVVPPHSLVIRVVEREPIGVLERGDAFDVVDAAGVVLRSAGTRPEDMPAIRLPGVGVDSSAFRSVARVLMALPQALHDQVDTITASTSEDVTLILSDGTRVLWGGSGNSQLKAEVLDALIAQKLKDVVQYDVSAPDSAVVTRG